MNIWRGWPTDQGNDIHVYINGQEEKL